MNNLRNNFKVATNARDSAVLLIHFLKPLPLNIVVPVLQTNSPGLRALVTTDEQLQ